MKSLTSPKSALLFRTLQKAPRQSMRIISAFLFIFSANVLMAADDTAITVTNSNLALVRETRQLQMTQGAHSFNLVDIPTSIQPSSVLIESRGNSFSVLEQNYEYDLVSATKVLEKSLNQQIRLLRPKAGELRGELISVSSQYLMVLDQNKQLQIVPRGDDLQIMLPEYAGTSGGFITRPTLVWQVNAKRGGRHDATITYLTGGMNWNADYTGRLSADEKELLLAGWVTVENNSGKTFKDARLKLMAGDLHLIKSGRRNRPAAKQNEVFEFYSAKPAFSEKTFFEYHLYSLDRKTTLANNQVKQIQLFPEIRTPVNKKYIVDSNKSNDVNVVLSLKNSKKNHLGFPLPGGKIRLYKADGKDMEFIGEDAIKHTPEKEDLNIKAGRAFDVVSERRVIKTERPSKRSRRQTVEYTLRSHKKSNVEVEIIEHLNAYQQNKLLSSTIQVSKKQADRFTFKVPLRAESEYTLTIEYATNW